MPCFSGILANVFRYLHRAEGGTVHAAEMRGLGSLLRERFIMKFTRRVWNGPRRLSAAAMIVNETAAARRSIIPRAQASRRS
jgi:hypothetical protein